MTFDETQWLTVVLLALLAATAVIIVRRRGLWEAVMLSGIYSFLGASWMMLLDAPDVAFTEAAVGAGISTVLMLGTLALTSREEKPPKRPPWVPLAVVTATGAALIWGTFDMPHIGDPNAPAQVYPDPSYIERSAEDIDVPNVVTAVLSSYRGYDTLGETVVVFTAGLVVLVLLRGRREEYES
ncbi:MAG: DUF4040 domain-containing protein [Acidobacteriota bacterium]